MKRILFTAIAVLCLLGTGTVFAQDRDHSVQAQIPFGFCVGNTSLPAGTYVLGRLPGSQCVAVVRNSTTGEAVFNMAQSDWYGPQEHPGKLVFNQYGNQYFLSEIHGIRAINRMTLPVSSREKQARMELANVQVYEQDIIPQK